MTSLSGKLDPVVRPITAADVVEALGQGARDFRALPLYGLGFAAIYVLGGIIIVLSITVLGMSYLAYPLAAGFALIAPFVAGVFYEASRERERGRPPTLSGLWRAGVDPMSPIMAGHGVPAAPNEKMQRGQGGE